MVFPSLADATPVMSSETINGMIVIRIAFTQSVPIGATMAAALCSVAFPDAATAAPSTSARTSAMQNAHTFVHAGYIMRSPPLISSDAPVM